MKILDNILFDILFAIILSIGTVAILYFGILPLLSSFLEVTAEVENFWIAVGVALGIIFFFFFIVWVITLLEDDPTFRGHP